MNDEAPSLPLDPGTDSTRRALQHVVDALRDLRYGEITVKVQDGRIIQVDRTVKQRLPRTQQRT